MCKYRLTKRTFGNGDVRYFIQEMVEGEYVYEWKDMTFADDDGEVTSFSTKAVAEREFYQLVAKTMAKTTVSEETLAEWPDESNCNKE